MLGGLAMQAIAAKEFGCLHNRRRKQNMDKELAKVMAWQSEGSWREEAVAGFRKQMAEWDCAMPGTEILVSDFGLGRFMEIGLVESWIVNDTAGNYCGKYLFTFDGQRCPNHKHNTKRETFFVVKGKVKMTCNGMTRIMLPGDVLTIEPGQFHTFVGLGPALLLEVSMLCIVDDNYFENPDIPYGLNKKKN